MLIYNDEFDKTHYPITERHQAIADELKKIFVVPDNVKWYYEATIHGKILTTSQIFGGYKDLWRRIHRDRMEAILKMPEIRWVECRVTDDEASLAFGI